MRIFDYFKNEKKTAGSAPLAEAVEKAPKLKGFYIIEIGQEKKYIGIAENGLREKFIDLYSGLHLEGDTIAINAYENRDKIIVHWVEENSEEKAKEYIDKFTNTYELDWLK
ncbi:hypothetical protein EUAN_07340 [Andreesenia angusta]|uniref:GIY-YIG domain-containing protein n=1 Tax=Andreesenia angusta TaxID=39480 RepID=A0A1S1V972_9FIRM|nr:hypothetical protein [Andreesenia angusta]OHW62950.1 hypothetical protein EUAN_07340 [Andreesenia angusta]